MMHQMKITSSLVLVFVVGVRSFPTKPYHTYLNPTKYYAFSYGVKDDGKGLDFSQDEKSNGNAVHGSYSVRLPDGRKQIVNYKADHYRGFWADVAYEGTAAYPPESAINLPFTVPVHDDNANEDEVESEFPEETRQETTAQHLLSEETEVGESMHLEYFPLENVSLVANFLDVEDVPSETEAYTVLKDDILELGDPIPLEDLSSEREQPISSEEVPLEAENPFLLEYKPNMIGQFNPLANVADTESPISLDELSTDVRMPMSLKDVLPEAGSPGNPLEDVALKAGDSLSFKEVTHEAEYTIPLEEVSLKTETPVLLEDNPPVAPITLPPIEANKVTSEETLLYLDSSS